MFYIIFKSKNFSIEEFTRVDLNFSLVCPQQHCMETSVVLTRFTQTIFRDQYLFSNPLIISFGFTLARSCILKVHVICNPFSKLSGIVSESFTRETSVVVVNSLTRLTCVNSFLAQFYPAGIVELLNGVSP